MPSRSNLCRAILAALAAVMVGFGQAGPARADMPASLNLWGSTGLIDMPSGEQQPDGFFGLEHGQFGPVFRNTLTFQITPRLSGSFRYLGIHDWNRLFCPPNCTEANAFHTYFDRNFDLRYQVLNEGRFLPAVTVGLQDFVGTGLSAAEYIAATKSIGPRLKVTAGLGFGRLGTFGSIGTPFGPRDQVKVGQGGVVNYKQWFHGNAAPFGGLEYQVNDKWSLKAEYSSDAYAEEATLRETFLRRSPFNFGVEYRRNPNVTLGAYYMYGKELGFNFSVLLNPAQRHAGGIGGSAPEPVLPRPSRAENPRAYLTGWVTQLDAKEVLMRNLQRNLVRTGITVEALGVTADTAQVRFRNTTYDAAAQAVGRVARAMSQTMPASVETFEIVPVTRGLAAAKVTIHRADFEALEFSPDAAAALRARITITDPGTRPLDFALNPELYPRFTWYISPYLQTKLFDPREPFQANENLALGASYEIAPGVILTGRVTKKIVGDINISKRPDSTPLPPVRRDADVYDKKADPDLEVLTAEWLTHLGKDVYGRVTVGYLERMFAGVSGEVLWKPDGKRWALGVEANYVAQRDPDGGLGFGTYDYRVATGHVSGYFDLGKGYTGEIDLGRYLAGDVGGTLTLTREFANGWKFGAFATLTNVPFKDFGEGSFDKGIFFVIPLSYVSQQPTRSVRPFVIRPVGRDGGARLSVNDRLYGTLREYDAAGIDEQWGRVWK